MKVNAIYQPSFGQYRGNPLIEALPPIRNFNDIKTALSNMRAELIRYGNATEIPVDLSVIDERINNLN